MTYYVTGAKFSCLKKDKQAFEKACIKLIARGCDTVNTYKIGHDYLEECLCANPYETVGKKLLIEMLRCDFIYALKGWEDQRGSKTEVFLAMEVGIPVIFQK